MKQTILGVLAVVLSTSAFSIFAAKKFKNKIEIGKTVRILNLTEEKSLNSVLQKGIQILGIKNVLVVVVNLTPEEMEEETLMGFIHDQETYYLVKLRPGLSENYYLDILSHELIHLYDMHSGRLKLLYYGFLYDNVVYTFNTFYWERPFEKRAFDYEEILKLLIISNPPLSN